MYALGEANGSAIVRMTPTLVTHWEEVSGEVEEDGLHSRDTGKSSLITYFLTLWGSGERKQIHGRGTIAGPVRLRKEAVVRLDHSRNPNDRLQTRLRTHARAPRLGSGGIVIPACRIADSDATWKGEVPQALQSVMDGNSALDPCGVYAKTLDHGGDQYSQYIGSPRQF